MKKLALVLLALAITFPLVAGDVDGATVSIGGDATTTFGMDLDTNATGFTNTLNAKLQLNFGLGEEAIGSGMDDGGIYGEVGLVDIVIKTQENNNAEDTAAVLTMNGALDYAKIVGPTWWVSVKGQDDTIDFENASQNGIIGIAAAWDGQMDNVKNDPATSGGFEAGISIPDIATVELSVYSITDWTDALDTDIDNAYGIKVEVGLDAVENLTLQAGANFVLGSDLSTSTTTTTEAVDAVYGPIDSMGTPDTADDVPWIVGPIPSLNPANLYIGVITPAVAATTTVTETPLVSGFGGKLAYEIAVGDMTITPEVGADIVMLDGGGMDMAIGNGLMVALAGDEIGDAADAIEDSSGNGEYS